MLLGRYICLFMLYSFMGWTYECLFCVMKTGKWGKRSFLYGPVCPIYGTGALIMTLDAWHAEAERFITIKTTEGKIEKANLSLEIDDEFMEAVEKYYNTGEIITKKISRDYEGNHVEYEVTPIEIYKKMIETAWDWGEPGCIFTNRFCNYNIMEKDEDYNIVSPNPCGEQPLPAGGACCLASINLAAQQARKTLFVCSGLMNACMRLFTRRESKEPGDLFDFRFRYFDELKHLESMKKRGFVMVAGVSKLAEVEQLCRLLPENETLLIYSSWDGYYKNPNQVQLNPKYALFREAFHNVVDIHTSGHADRKTIRQVIETVHPKETICIHKEKGQSLEFLGIK